MKYEHSERVYCCCGQYIAKLNSTQNKKAYCPRCGKALTKPITQPNIVIVKP